MTQQCIIYFDISNTLLNIYNVCNNLSNNIDISYIIENKIKSISKICNTKFEIIIIIDNLFNVSMLNIDKYLLINSKQLINHIKSNKSKIIYIYNKNNIIIKLLNIESNNIYTINTEYKITNINNIQLNLYNKIQKKCKYLLLDKKCVLTDITFLFTFLDYNFVIQSYENVIIYNNIINNYITYLNKYNTYLIDNCMNINFSNFKNYLLHFIDYNLLVNYNYNFNNNSRNYRYLKNLQYKFLDNMNQNLSNWKIYNISISIADIIIYIEKYNTFLYNLKY